MRVDVSHAHASDELTLEIVAALESSGLAHDDYHLGDSFDPAALARLLESCSGSAVVSLEVEGVSLVVTNERVRVVDE